MVRKSDNAATRRTFLVAGASVALKLWRGNEAAAQKETSQRKSRS